jgi:hypothetical protein
MFGVIQDALALSSASISSTYFVRRDAMSLLLIDVRSSKAIWERKKCGQSLALLFPLFLYHPNTHFEKLVDLVGMRSQRPQAYV